jgi:leucyl aminopeptidase
VTTVSPAATIAPATSRGAPRFEVVSRVPENVAVLGVPVFADLSVPTGAGATVDRAFLAQRRFDGQPGQAQAMLADDGSTIVALGVGPIDRLDGDALRRAGAALARQAGNASEVATTLAAAALTPEQVVAAVEGIGLGAYRFEGARRPPRPGRLERVLMVAPATRGRGDPRPGLSRPAIEAAVHRGQVDVVATWRARDWVNRPPRDLTPTELARVAAEAAVGTPVTVEVWDRERIEAERLGGLLGVAAGASEPPRLLRLSYEPPAARATVALVGKGITFDSGGLSLKTPTGMMTMKSDMGGAAAVIAATVAAAELELPLRVVGWVAATENMPSGTAIHPGDVLVARNGTSIEVLNTDAEGRLVLADALSLAAEEEPDAIVDIATLTGGQRVALGEGVAAIMGTDEILVRRLIAAGAAAGEPLWELPLVAAYRKQLDSEVADLRNVSAKPSAPSIIAALFLKEFSGRRPWAHLDIAAPSWADGDDGWLTKGGTGWGARTLIELLTAWPH